MPLTNTLESTRRLEEAGFQPQQARRLAELLEDTARVAQPDLSNLATKEDVRAMKEEIGKCATKDELRVEIKDLELRIGERLRAQMLWFVATQLAIVSAAIAVLKLIA